jgi:ribonuclease G
MSIEILINVATRETRAALVENGVLQEVFIERASRRGIVSNLYKGRVSRVMPGMQAAFIDVGLERTAFLHVGDIARAASEGQRAAGAAGTRADDTMISEQRVEDIRRLVNPGDELLVQVVKDPLGTKGARLTTFVALPSRYLVFMPRGEGIGVSTRIEDETERARLRECLRSIVPADSPGGFIVRTAAIGASVEQLRADMSYLGRLWEHVRGRSLSAQAGELVHEDLPLPLRILRDELPRGIERVWVDSAEVHERMLEFAHAFMPEAATHIERYVGTRPIFDLHGVEEELGRALDREVPLKSGGHVIIDQTEAMTTIDVNTGAFVGHRNLEDTIFRTNLEAAVAIARQLRLRNLGGIIIIDFIDMQDEAHRSQVIEALQRALAADHSQTHIASLSPLGLVEMTRKRTRESLEHLLCARCPTCEGRGFVRTAETVCHEIFREVLRQSRQFTSNELLILAHQDVVERLLDEDSAAMAELEGEIGRTIRLQTEALYGVDQYDVVLM